MKNVLIVDDSPTIRRMVKTALQKMPETQFYEAASGLEAIEIIALTQIHAIVLDLNMPDMHGLDFLKFIKNNPITNKIPVMILTTRGDEESKSLALTAGASIYMTKPFNPDTILEKVSGMITNKPENQPLINGT